MLADLVTNTIETHRQHTATAINNRDFTVFSLLTGWDFWISLPIAVTSSFIKWFHHPLLEILKSIHQRPG